MTEETNEREVTGADEAEASARPSGIESTRPAIQGEAHLKSILESLIFVADKPVPIQRLVRLTRAKAVELAPLLQELVSEYRGRGIELIEVAGGYQFRSAAANAPFVRDMIAQRPVRLTRAQLETLAIISYRQPVTRPELEDIRGVDSGSAVKVLADRGMIKILGRKDEPGRPLIYGTTPLFLEFFGLASLKDLPTLEEFTELTEESRALFQKKMEQLDLTQMADIEEIPEGMADEGDDVTDEPEDDPAADEPSATTEDSSANKEDGG